MDRGAAGAPESRHLECSGSYTCDSGSCIRKAPLALNQSSFADDDALRLEVGAGEIYVLEIELP